MKKLYHLQGIRGFAILSVVVFHYLPEYCPNGFLGVDIFFVLSGYLMALSMSSHEKLLFFSFYCRRIKRILPLYYGILLTCTALLVACSCTEQQTNLVSSLNAILFKTNLVWDDGHDYFAKLGAAHDIFTHTWSLCVEIQFYLLFPIIWLLYKEIPGKKHRLGFLTAISGGSLFLAYNTSEEKAFYNVFCRLWQFLTGCIAFHNEESKNSGDEKILNISAPPDTHPMKCCLLLAALFSTIILCGLIPSVFMRLIITVTTAFLITYGRDFNILQNFIVVFFGEISYSWYLIHWPMLSFQKIFVLSQNMEYSLLFLNLFAGVLISTIVYYGIEKKYLTFSRKEALFTVFLFLSLCLAVNYYLFEFMNKTCNSAPSAGPNFKTMTKGDFSHYFLRKFIEEIKKYNFALEKYEYMQLKNEGCVFDPPSNTFEGFCRFNNSKANNKKKLLIIGNSYAANVAPVIFEECSGKVENIYRTAYVGCEVLYDHPTEYCRKAGLQYSAAVRRVQPDYLFLIAKYTHSIKKKTPEAMKEAIQTAIQRIQAFSRLVRKRIFILNTLPRANISATDLANAIDQNHAPKWDFNQQDGIDESGTRKAVEKIVASCPKCELFDYTPSFTVNGSFCPYDPEYFVTYFTKGLHLTQPGLEKIHHIYADICKNKIE